jgi:acetylornithine deacetylase/succinyl-diaminopimelate desuccinylase-like protein
MKVKDFYYRSIEERRKFIKDYIEKSGLYYETQMFRENGDKGVNFLILEWKRKDKPNIIITAHYDGFGAYDNAGGVAGLLWLLRWIKFDNLKSFDYGIGIIIVFTDKEERDLVGAKHLIKHKIFDIEKIYAHLSLDGFGIGTNISGFANSKEVRLKINSTEETVLTLHADTTVFQEKGIPSIHLFTLPEKELSDLVSDRLFPPTWRIIHTKKDTPENIDDCFIPFVMLNIYKNIPELDFTRNGIITIGG